jgi:hypothetical protein
MVLPTELEIVPHVGIGPVRFGMTREEVNVALSALAGAKPGRPKGGRSTTIMSYLRGSLQVEFGADGTASFIEVSGDQATLCTYKGCDVFDLPATESFALFAADDASGQHAFSAAGYLFPQLIVALWCADTQYDHKGNVSRSVYATVGVGDARYLEAIRKSRGSSTSS